MASTDDLLSASKNNVIAINTLGTIIGNWFGWTKGTSIPRVASSTSTATLFTVPTNSTFTLTDLEICNTAATAATFTIYIVASGGSASASNALFYNAPINGNTTVQWTGSQFMTAGGFLSGKASATTVAFTIGGRVAA